jgi:hypothetical protein
MTASSTSARASAPRPIRRSVDVPTLADLQGPQDGKLNVPRRLYWSGDDQCGQVDLHEENEVALAYESIIDAAHHTADLVENLNAELLVRLWPTLGMGLARRQAWETRNPELTATRIVSAVAVA